LAEDIRIQGADEDIWVQEGTSNEGLLKKKSISKNFFISVPHPVLLG
jgi:hypothetical protein